MLKSQLKKPHLKLKKLKIICTVAFSSLLFPAWGLDDPMLVFVSQNDRWIQFELPSNPSTGYRWQILSYDHRKLAYVKTEYQVQKPGLIGGGGVEKFYFKRKNSQAFQTRISLQYARHWEKKPAKTQVVEITTN